MTAAHLALLRTADARSWLLRRLAVAGPTVLLGDWLFYGEYPGISVAIFGGAVGLGACLVNPVRAEWRARILAGLVLAAGLLPIAVAGVDALSFALLGAALVAEVWLLAHAAPLLRWDFARALVTTPLSGPFRLLRDLWRVARLVARQPATPRRRIDFADLRGWLVPLGLGGVFVLLFASANPILNEWLTWLDPRELPRLADPLRLMFWGVLICAIWPFLHAKFRTRVRAKRAPRGPRLNETVFGPTVILRSLVLFNALFGLQTLLDLTYLWSGHTLPAGMSHAAYAHRGAYPLMVSALLAAAFVIEASRHERAGAERSRIRALLLLFLAQNVVLVASAILRLDLYVAAYGLTLWRLSALIWMALVAFGLGALAVKIVARRSGAWLVRVNVVACLAVLYGCSLMNFSDRIGRYNLARCADGSCAAVGVDWDYLASLGPQVIPAIDAFLETSPTPRDNIRAASIRYRLVDEFAWKAWGGWRQWSLEAWRLERYLATHRYASSRGTAP